MERDILVSWKEKIRNIFKMEHIMYFFILYVLLVFRAPEDFFEPYLWAEDGTVLIQGAVQNGIQEIFIPGNGTYWLIQKILARLCYWIVSPFGAITLLPYIMQSVAKIIITLSVMYFISDKFEWLISRKFYRFCICIGIILLMPQYASDTLTCETSLPFPLFFVVYLIGLDLLCSSKRELPSLGQTIFMCLLSLSSANGLCIGVVVGVIAIRYFVNCFKYKRMEMPQFCFDVIKILLVFSAAFIQTKCVLSAGRVSQQLELGKRIILNTKSFMFFPYWNYFHSWIAFFIGGMIWICIWRRSKIPCFTVIYSAGFSYFAMLYNCMAENVQEAYLGGMTARYVFICFEIAAFMVGIAVSRLIENADNRSKVLAYICLVCVLLVSLRTYNIPVVGENYADCYKFSSVVYDQNGNDDVIIPIGPWEPWVCEIPANISEKEMKEDLEIGIEFINGNEIGTVGFETLTSSDIWNLSGWIRTSEDNEILTNLFIKKGTTYIAAESIEIRDNFFNQKLLHNGYKFSIAQRYELFCEENNLLEFVGETNDGVWHSGKVMVEMAKEY